MTNKKHLYIEKPLIVWGTGIEALRFSRRLFSKGEIDISAYIDNGGGIMGFFEGKKVYKFSWIENQTSYFYIFAGNLSTYVAEIRPQLLEAGLLEFKDFLYFEWYWKKILFLHGNCHMSALNAALMCSEEFCEKYCIYPIKLIYTYKQDESVDLNALAHIDVFVHEDIRSDNSFGYKMSDEYLVPKLKTNCTNITIPHLFGLCGGCFPQTVGSNSAKRNPPLRNGEDFNGMFPHRDRIIEQLIEQKIPVEDMVKFIQGDVFSESEIQSHFDMCMDRIRERENAWDIKISDFIIEHFQKEKLFYDIGHPTEIIISYIATKVLSIMGICTGDVKLDSFPMDTHETPVYPCVYRTLGLEWDNESIRKRGKRIEDKMDIGNYVREYVSWCYPEYNTTFSKYVKK